MPHQRRDTGEAVAPKPYAPNPAWITDIRALVAQAPPLTPRQLDRLAALLSVAKRPARSAEEMTEASALGLLEAS